MTTPCGHVLCHQCLADLESHTQENAVAKCPECRKPLPTTHQPSSPQGLQPARRAPDSGARRQSPRPRRVAQPRRQVTQEMYDAHVARGVVQQAWLEGRGSHPDGRSLINSADHLLPTIIAGRSSQAELSARVSAGFGTGSGRSHGAEQQARQHRLAYELATVGMGSPRPRTWRSRPGPRPGATPHKLPH